MKSTVLVVLAFSLFLFGHVSSGAEPAKVVVLWPGMAPGEKGDIGEERDTTKPAAI